ncbi:MAG: tRNA (N(6)-L-threonylcarbamoyladenosine(37)-C(2))-methylthiotransferase MtaB [Pseudomonadota bacterium]
MQAQVINFGCRVNAIEQFHMGELLDTSDHDTSNVIVVNSCAVTAEAERQLQQRLRKLRKTHPEKRIILSGCAAQLRPEFYGASDDVDHVIGNHEKLLPHTWSQQNLQANDPERRVQVGDIMQRNMLARDVMARFGGRARAFVQVQTGCDHRCTFCTIPFARGNSHSFSLDDITAQIREFVSNGYQEVVLSGIDIASFRTPQKGLGGLINHILDTVPALPRLRISTLDCIDVDEDFLRALAHQPRLMPHVHLSLQSGDDMILKRMKRRHLRNQAQDFIAKMREARPDLVLGADIIAGFPTETEAMFENTLEFVRSNKISWLHVFPYSERPGTPAAKIPKQVPRKIRLARAKHLRHVGKEIAAHTLQKRIGALSEVVIERDNIGKDPYYCQAQVIADAPLAAGSRVPVKVMGVQDRQLHATYLGA